MDSREANHLDEGTIKEYYEKYPQGLPGLPSIPEVYEGHQYLITRVRNNHPSRLLDAGCGKGYLGEELVKYVQNYYGFDLSDTAIAIAGKRIKGGKFRAGSISKLPYENECFDCIVCSEVLEHIPRYPIAIQELSRVLKPGGEMLVSTPNKLNPDMLLRTIFRGKYTDQIYDKPIHYKELTELFVKNGLEIKEFFSFFFFPPGGESFSPGLRESAMVALEWVSRFVKVPLGLYLFFTLHKPS